MSQTVLGELFIDGVVMLSREAKDLDIALPEGPNRVTDWLVAQQRVQQEQRALENDELRYGCFNLRDEVSAVNDAAVVQRTIDGVAQPQQALLLAFQLQFLLNARRPGLYALQLQDRQRSSKVLRLLNGRETYADLSPWLVRVLQGDPANPFYESHHDGRFLSVVGVDVIMDEGDVDTAAAPIRIVWNSTRCTLSLQFYGENPFFDVVAANIDEFMAALATFMRNEGDIDALTGVSENSYQRYYAKINATQCEYPRQTIVGMFEQQARALNDHPAVITKNEVLSYRMLQQQASRLADYLQRQYGVAAGDKIALMMPREAELVVCLMAVLKLGCTYIPIDKNAPVVRTYSILADAQPALIIGAHAQSAGSLPQGLNYLDWREYAASPFAGADGCNEFPSQAEASALAYIIYTSGTTGKPKGVAVEHRSFVNIASDISRRMSVTHQDRFLAITTLAFDISTLEIFMPLMFGATVVLTDQKTLLANNDLPQFIASHSVSLMQGTPSFWHQVVQQYAETTLGAVGFAFDHPLAFAQAVPQRTQKTVDFVAAPDGQRRFGGEHDVSAAAFEQVLSGQAPGGDIVHRDAVEQRGIDGRPRGKRIVVADDLHAPLGGPDKMGLANVARRHDDAAHAMQEHIVDKRGLFLFLAVGVAEQDAVAVSPRRAVDRMRQR
ncbi:TPA: amino acid adenylation domain-containing protein [Serratia marcescens]|nr:amino acid adenylation domain-containing protein [Serratia marcescens]